MQKLFETFWLQGHFNLLCYALLANAALGLLATFERKTFSWEKSCGYLKRIAEYTVGLFSLWLFAPLDSIISAAYFAALGSVGLLVVRNLTLNVKDALGLDLGFLEKWLQVGQRVQDRKVIERDQK